MKLWNRFLNMCYELLHWLAAYEQIQNSSFLSMFVESGPEFRYHIALMNWYHVSLVGKQASNPLYSQSPGDWLLTGRTKDYVTSVPCMVDVAGTAVRDSVGWEMWGTVLVGDVEDSVGGRCGGQCGGWPLGCRDELIRRYPVARVQICDFSHNTQHLTQIGTKLRFKKKNGTLLVWEAHCTCMCWVDP